VVAKDAYYDFSSCGNLVRANVNSVSVRLNLRMPPEKKIVAINGNLSLFFRLGILLSVSVLV
jgi:hypothetical protein